MKLELIIFSITGFLIYNTYYDFKYSKMLVINKKYIQMSMFGFVGFTLYLLIKKNPTETKSVLSHANSLIKYMPIDKNTRDILSPILDFTKVKNELGNFSSSAGNMVTPQMKRMLNSGRKGGGTKRSVSETKKKYVASNQNWKCGMCGNQLTATFEVDHKIELQDGGSNHVTNLAALCPNCHREKSMKHNL